MTKAIKHYRVHPLCAMFPKMDDEAYAALRDDMARNGQREPITVHEGQILDGRNRYDICKDLGLKPKTRVWDGKGKLVDFVASMNMNRRHLDTSQRAMVAAEMAKYSIQLSQASNDACGRLDQNGAATLMNVSESAVDRASVVVESGAKALSEAVKSGDVSVSLAAQAAQNLSTPEQIKALRRAKTTGEEPAAVLRKAVAKKITAESVKADTRKLRSGKEIITPGMRKQAVLMFGKLVRYLHKMKLKDRLEKHLEAIDDAIKHAI